MLERVVSSKIYSYLMHNNILHPKQYSFVRGNIGLKKPTITNLIGQIHKNTNSKITLPN